MESEEFLSFVENQISELTKLSQIDPYNITFHELNQFLSKYEQINLNLLGLSAFLENELDKKKREFDLWFAEKYIIARNKENKPEISAQKWASQRELDYLVKVQNKEEYITLQTEVSELERKLNFVNGLLKSWGAQLTVLLRLSSNLETEVKLDKIRV